MSLYLAQNSYSPRGSITVAFSLRFQYFKLAAGSLLFKEALQTN